MFLIVNSPVRNFSQCTQIFKTLKESPDRRNTGTVKEIVTKFGRLNILLYDEFTVPMIISTYSIVCSRS